MQNAPIKNNILLPFSKVFIAIQRYSPAMSRERAHEERYSPKRSTREQGRNILSNPVAYWIPSTLPDRDLEIFTITTHNTVLDYVRQDMAFPRDRAYADKIVAVPIPTQKEFAETKKDLSLLLEEIREHTDDTAYPYTLTSLVTNDGESFLVLKMRQTFYEESPARVVLLHEDEEKRTHGFFTTDKILPTIIDRGIPVIQQDGLAP